MSSKNLLNNRYRVLKELGRGGFGRTYLVEDTTNISKARRVVKQLAISPHIQVSSWEAQKMFEREMRHLEKLGNRSTQLATLYDNFEENGQFFYVQEWIEGSSLSDEFGNGRRKSESDVVLLLLDILEALSVIHTDQCMHLDLKPANLMRRADNGNRVVLVDFGAMRSIGSLMAEESLTDARRIIGTLGYMAPEQLGGQPKPASDIHAVGMIGLFALTGINPHPEIKGFSHTSNGEINWQPYADVRPDFARCLRQMVRSDWRERPRSAMEAKRMLRDILNSVEKTERVTTSTPRQNTQRKRRAASYSKPVVATGRPIISTGRILTALMVGIIGTIVFKVRNPSIEARADESENVQVDRFKDNEQAVYWRLQGDAANKANQYKKAVNNYDKAIGIKPDYHQAWFGKGISLSHLASYEDALASYEKAVEIKPDYHEAWYGQGNSLRKLGRYEDAISSYDKAIEVKPNYHEAWSNLGVSLHDLGRHEDAIASYDKAIGIKSDYHGAWSNRGISLSKLGRYEDAIASYDKAVKIKPDSHEAWFSRGISLAKLDLFEESIASFGKTVEIKPDYHEAWFNRGISLAKLDLFEESIANFDKTVDIKPDYHEAWFNRGVSLAKLERYDQAIASFDKTVGIEPDYHAAWFNRGVFLGKLERYDQAIASFDKTVGIKPDDHAAWFNRGVFLGKLERYDQAIASFDKALEIQPTSEAYRQGRDLALKMKQRNLSLPPPPPLPE